jgi:hypothetical protein
MKALLAVILVVLVGLTGLGNLGTAQAEDHSTLSEAEKQRILQATVRIDMAVGEVPGVDRMDGNALGSVVKLEGQTVVITHNHWAPLLDATSTITLSAADHTPIATMTGQQLYAAILDQDAGTIIFQAPKAMLDYLQNAHIALPEAVVGQALAPGSVVWSVFFSGKVGEELGVRPIMVEKGKEDQQPPVYRLRSLDEKPNQTGDSGGGIWYEGRLVGNMWAIEMEPAPTGGWQHSAVSDAAVLNW